MSSTLSTRQWRAGAGVLFAVLCSASLDAQEPAAEPQTDRKTAHYFADATAASGLDFRYWNGRSGEWFFPEINGAGAALFDYDDDGDLDLYLLQGALLGAGKTREDALDPLPTADGSVPRDVLLRNDLEVRADGSRSIRFVDVTASSGIDAPGYGMAVGVGDFDDDGHPDLYVANFGANQLWRNLGDGTFEDVTEAWRAGDSRWSSAVSIFDADRDGDLDLFVGNYLRFSLAKSLKCKISTGQYDYCHPSTYRGETDVFLRNDLYGAGAATGQLTFVDWTTSAFPDAGHWPTLGVVTLDADGDGLLDLYVANDDQPNQLWRNQGDGTFADEALLTGTAVNGRGQPEASMGLAAGDVDGDGDEDLFVTHLDQQTNTLYVNAGGFFRDRTDPAGLGAPSLPFTGFGTAFVDLENDGDLDLVSLNGAVQVVESLARGGDPWPFHQRNQIFENLGGGRFREVEPADGDPFFAADQVSRGAAVGDIDNDGDLDLVEINNNGPARLLLTTQGDPKTPAPWIGLRLVTASGRDALGALATLVFGGTQVSGDAQGLTTMVRRARTDGGYASAHDPRVLFGLGGAPGTPSRVDVRWADGTEESFPAPPIGEYSTLVQGRGDGMDQPAEMAAEHPTKTASGSEGAR